MKNNKRFVLDTNLFISSLLSRTSPPAAVFDFIVSGDDDLLVLKKIENTAIVSAKTLEQMIISKQI